MAYPNPGGGRYMNGGQEDGDNERKDNLRLFFELRDRKFVSIVDDLFRLYTFQDIATGLFRKYRLVPYGWRNELIALKQRNDPSLAWFDPNRDIYLRETTDNYPGVERKLVFPERKANEDVERVVDEFIKSERSFFERLQVFIRSYVAEIDAIASEKVGPDAKRALGLDSRQVDFIFGSSLMKVYDATESLLVGLETLTLVHSNPKVPGGRPGSLADFVMLSGQRLVQAYATYNANYSVSKRVLKEKEAMVAGAGQRSPYMPTGPMRHLNFVELWTEISQSKPLLKNMGIDSVLITPIKKFPNYKIFFERLLKLTPAMDPAYVKLKNALEMIEQFARQIDGEVKKQGEFADRFFNDLMNN